MKVILIKDVAKVGRRHEVKDLSDGYARNFIIARGWGIVADEKNLARLKNWQEQSGTDKKIQKDLLQKLLAHLGEKAVVISRKANEQGHLFASLHAADIAAALREQCRIAVTPEMIDLPAPIKAVGEYQIDLKAAERVGRFPLRVEGIK